MGRYESASAISGLYESMFGTEQYAVHSRRLSAYRRYWQYYLGQHWSYERDPGEPSITVNLIRRIVNLHTDFTFKKGFEVIVPDDPGTPENEKEDREFVRLMLEETWRRNNKNLWALEAGQMGSVTGDVFARISWETNDPLEDPYARVDLIPSHLVLPEFGGPHGVDRKKLLRVAIITPVFVPRIGAVSVRRPPSSIVETYRVVMKAEVWESARYDALGVQTSPCTVQHFEDGTALDEPTPTPLGEIPIVHIPNYPLAGEYYGMSDVVDAIDLNREFNEKITDVSDIINYHSSPTTVVVGAKLKDLEKGANRVWGLPEGASVSNLMLNGDLGAANTHLDMLRSSLLEMTSTPPEALGQSQAISNTTGIALQMQYMPMMEKRDVKVLTYSMGLRLINRLILKMTSIANATFGKKFDALAGNKYRNDIVFPDPMPWDETRELALARERMSLSLSTRAREMERIYGYSQKEIEDIDKELEDDIVGEMSALYGVEAVPGAGRGNATLQRGGSPGTLGARIDETLSKRQATGDQPDE